MKKYNLEYISRLEVPIELDPQIATFDDVGIWAMFRNQPRLGQSTVNKRLRYARFMEKHTVPVDFRNPDRNNFIRHLDYREQIEKASTHALRHEWKTMKMFLSAYGMPHWTISLPPESKSRKRIIPYPYVVHKFFSYPYHPDKDETVVMQYLFYQSFLIGWRTPSEIVELKTDDIIINNDGTGIITITETKKHKLKRTICPEKEILSDYRRKSMKNWIDVWRPKFETQHSKDHLFIQPKTGKPYTVRHLGHKLSKYGKMVWKHFHPYDMRHWCAIARLTQQKTKTGTFDCYPVRNWHGHETIKTTMEYIRYAEQYYNQAPYDWIRRVLKYHRKMIEENPAIKVREKSMNPQKTGSSNQINPVGTEWARRDLNS